MESVKCSSFFQPCERCERKWLKTLIRGLFSAVRVIRREWLVVLLNPGEIMISWPGWAVFQWIYSIHVQSLQRLLVAFLDNIYSILKLHQSKAAHNSLSKWSSLTDEHVVSAQDGYDFLHRRLPDVASLWPTNRRVRRRHRQTVQSLLPGTVPTPHLRIDYWLFNNWKIAAPPQPLEPRRAHPVVCGVSLLLFEIYFV